MNVLKSRREFMPLEKFGRSAGVYGVTLSVIFRGCDCSPQSRRARVAILRESLGNRIFDAPVRQAASSGKTGFSELSDAHAQKNSTESVIGRIARTTVGRVRFQYLLYSPHAHAGDNTASQMGQ